MTRQIHSLGPISRKKIKTIILKDAYTPKFIAALFTIAKIWKKATCPSTDKWLRKMSCIYIYKYRHNNMYTTEYYSAINRLKICHVRQHG